MRIAFLSLLAATFLPAQIPGKFKQIDIDCGGWFTGFAQHSGGRLYGRTDVGGCYRSENGGDSWTFLSGDFATPGGLCVQGIAVASNDPNTVYQACGVSYFADDPDRGIWKSIDAGATWKQVKANLNFSGNDDARHGGECLLIHPLDDSEIWAGSRGDGLWRSTDSGKTWTQSGASTFDNIIITSVTIHPRFPDQIWVAGEGGLWISEDRGVTWKKELEAGVVFRTARRDDGSGFAIGGKYRPTSPNDTKLWHVTKKDWTNPGKITFTDRWPNYVTAFEKAKGYKPKDQAAALGLMRDGSLVTAGFFRAPAITMDDGLTFKLLPTKTVGKLPVWAIDDREVNQGGWNEIIQDSLSDRRWFTTGGYGPGRTDNSGQTWKYLVEGIGEVVTWRTHFHPTDPKIIVIPAADHGLTTIHDGGQSGNSVGTISRLFPWPDDILTFAHAVTFHGDTIIAAGGAPIPGEARLWRSEDKGATWKKIPAKGYPQKEGHEWVELVADLNNPDDLLALMGGSIGQNAGGIYRSLDGGATFSQASLPGALSEKNAGSEFVWNTRLRADGDHPDRRYFSFKDVGIFRSEDKGLTWKKLRHEGLPSPAGWLGVDRKVANRIWFSGYNGLHRSDDGGDGWLRIEGFEQTFDVDAVDGRVAVIGRKKGDDFKKIYYSGDNGSTWREITRDGYRFGNMDSVAVDPHRPGQVWISTNGRSTAVFVPK